jgi:hypothetical protein
VGLWVHSALDIQYDLIRIFRVPLQILLEENEAVVSRWAIEFTTVPTGTYGYVSGEGGRHNSPLEKLVTYIHS